MKAAIYSRKSKFSPKGESIENQIQMCKDYASINLRDKEITEFIEYEDEGYSGGNTNRPKFQKLMNDAKAKKFDILICYRLDRISRNVADFSSTLEILQGNNIDFVSIKEQFDTTTPMGRAMIYISSVFAQLERETIAERVKDNMLELAKTGRWLGGTPPLGYKSKTVKFLDESLTERSMSTLVSVPDELNLVKLIFDKYLELGSLSQLERYLLNNYCTSRNGSNFSKTTLKKILTNSVYVKSSDKIFEYLRSKDITVCGEADGIHGLLTYNKLKVNKSRGGNFSRSLRDTSDWIAAVSKHNGIIPDEEWLKAQNLLAKNRTINTFATITHNALLTGIIKCEKCGSRMRVMHGQISAKTGLKQFYYACSLKKDSRGERCDNFNVKANEVDDAVIASLKNIGINKCKFLESLMEKNKFQRRKIVQSNSPDILDNIILQKESQADNLVTKLSLEPELSDFIVPKLKCLKEELIKLKREREDVSHSIEVLEQEKLNFSFVQHLLDKCSVVDSLCFDEKKALVKSLVEKITWNGDSSELNIVFVCSDLSDSYGLADCNLSQNGECRTRCR